MIKFSSSFFGFAFVRVYSRFSTAISRKKNRTAFNLAVVLLCVAAMAPRVFSSSAERKNILFFLADDQRNEVLGCYGHPIAKTPTLDRLASEGVRFENAFCEVPICAASRASIFTGLSQRTHGFNFCVPPIERKYIETSYPVLLKAAGYRTGFVGKYGVEYAKPGMKERFDFFKPIDRNPYLKTMPDGSLRHETELCGDAAIEFIQSNSNQVPFCLSVSFNASHAEDGDLRPGYHFQWPKSTDGMYEGIQMPAPRLGDKKYYEAMPPFLQDRDELNRKRFYWRWDTPEKYQVNMRAYLRMVSGIDNTIARVLDALKEAGLDKNTVIVYTADNGYMMGDRGTAGKWNHYEQSLRVPLIIYDPSAPKEQRGRTATEMVSNIDLAPTFLRLAGVEPPPLYQGESLVPILKGETPDGWRKDIFCEHKFTLFPDWRGVRSESYKYAVYYDQPEGPYECLYDLKSDPEEFTNLAANPEYAKVREAMRKRLDAYNRNIPERPSDGKPPNIVLILSDDQAWTDYGFMGHPDIQTPNLDKLADQGIVFENGYVASPLCRPSLASLVTGRYPFDYGITGNDVDGSNNRAKLDIPVREVFHQFPSFIKLLTSNGYLAFQSGKWWEGSWKDGGFTGGMTHGDPARGGRHGDEGLKIGRETMRPVKDFIDQAVGEEKPFFLWYAPFMPHTPHNPPARLLEKYTQPGRPDDVAKYYAMCEWFDETCGDLLGYLDEKKVRGNTLVLYLSDNGWVAPSTEKREPGQKYWKGFARRSKGSPYENGTRTPIILSWPCHGTSGRADDLAHAIDFFPTIAAAAGLEAPADLPGINLLDKRARKNRKAVFGVCNSVDTMAPGHPDETLQYLWCIEGDWKLLLRYPGKASKKFSVLYDWDTAPARLYNLADDPGETNDLADRHPEMVQRLKKEIEAWHPVDMSKTE